MPLSPRAEGGPRVNECIDYLADQIADDGLIKLSVDLKGRRVLVDSDISEIQSQIADARARLDRLSMHVTYNRSALLTDGSGDFFVERVETSEARS